MTLQSYGIVNKPLKIVLNQLLRKKESLVLNNLESDFELFFGFKINLSRFKVQKFQARAFTLLAASFSQYFPSASILCISNVFGRVNLFDQNAFMECCIFFASLRG